MKPRLLLLASLLAIGAAPASMDPVRSLAGRYSATFPNAMRDGEKYTGENIVEIVPVAPRAAYVRVHTDWYNGHSCSLWGVAEAEGSALVYHEADTRGHAVLGQCTLSIRRAGRSLRLNDEDGEGCYRRHCGMRGSFRNVDLPLASRRPITYGARLRRSYQFKGAMAEWQAKQRNRSRR